MLKAHEFLQDKSSLIDSMRVLEQSILIVRMWPNDNNAKMAPKSGAILYVLPF